MEEYNISSLLGKNKMGNCKLLIEKSFREKFCILEKSRTFASRILSNCTKSLIFSTLLRQVSVVTTHAEV